MAHARLPNGSRVALGTRNPMLADVRNEIARAAAVAAEFNLVFECDLDDAVAVYDQLLNSLEKNRAHRLMERARLMYRTLKVEVNPPGAHSGDKPGETYH